MVKRGPNSAKSTTSTSKRRKNSANQITLERFFSRSPQKPSHTNLGRERVVDEESLDLATGRVPEAEDNSRRDTPHEQVSKETRDSPQSALAGSSRGATSSSPSDRTAVRLETPESKTGSKQVLLQTSAPPKVVVYKPLLEDPLAFDIDDAPWPSGTRAPYSFLAWALAALSNTRSRIAITNILTNALRVIIRHDALSLLPALYLLSNTLSPAYRSVELGLGPSIISKAIQHVSGLSSQALRRLYNATGDAGDVAYEAKSSVRTLIPHGALAIPAVYDALLKIAQAKGPGAAKQKQAVVERLLVAAHGEEVRFLVRTLSQNLRVGAVRTTLLSALARALVLTPPLDVVHVPCESSALHASIDLVNEAALSPSPKSKGKGKAVHSARDAVDAKFRRAEGLVRKVYVQHPNYDDIVRALLEVGLDSLAEHAPLSVGIPLLPTLASPARSVDEIYERLGDLPFTAEFKLDGQRAQIHAVKEPNGHTSARIFSRHLEEMTTKYPDVIQLIDRVFQNSSNTQSFIIDSEIVAVDPTDGSLKSFQELSNRARKDVALGDVKVAVAVFAFDLMYLDGEILLERPLRHRRQLLRDRLPPLPLSPNTQGAELRHVESCESGAGRPAIEAFWESAIESRCEGLMIKLLDSGEMPEESVGKRKPLLATYEPDKRTWAWLKLKKDYVNGLGDSLDLIPVGAWHGNGRKARWWSPVLMALYDIKLGIPVAMCKCMSGFSDAFYKALKERYPEDSDTCSRRPLWECNFGGLVPDVYFVPREVWEIRGAEVTVSPVSVAALGTISQTRGLSLRFPRFVRVREDRAVEGASTADFLASMYREQRGKGKDKSGADDGELVDLDQDDGDDFGIEDVTGSDNEVD